MYHVDYDMPASLLFLPKSHGEQATPCKPLSLARAIRYVMEQVPVEEKSRAIIRTSSITLYFNEIAALYDGPNFPRS